MLFLIHKIRGRNASRHEIMFERQILPKILQGLKIKTKIKKKSRQEREWVVWNDIAVCWEVASFSLSHTLQQPKYASQHENHTAF